MQQVGNLGEEGEVAPGGLRAAFDDVSGDDGTGQGVEIVSVPTEVRGGGADDHRGVGDPAGDHDVGAGVQAVHDAPAAEIGVGGQRRAETEFAGAGQQVVTFDMRDVDVEAEAVGQRADGGGQPGGVQSTRIGHDAHAAFAGQAEAFLELGQERLRVAAVGVFHPVAAQDQHRQLGQVVAGQEIEVTTGQHLPHGGVAVAVETRAVADAHRSRHAHSCPSTLTNQPVGYPEPAVPRQGSPRPAG